MSDPAAGDPFKHLPPPFGDLVRMMRQQAGDPTTQARAFAVQVATEGNVEPNVDPLVRMKVEQLARVAELRVVDATGLELTASVEPCTRSHWALTTIDHYRRLFDRLGEHLADVPDADDDPDSDRDSEPDPLGWLAPLMQAMQPMMLSLTTGSLVGHLAVRGFGSYELPVPRPPDAPVLLIAQNALSFAADWSLPDDDLILWLCLHQLTHHAVLSIPHVRDRLDSLLDRYVTAFQHGGADLDDLLGGIDLSDPASLADPAALQRQLGSPGMLIGMILSDEQRELLPQIHAVVGAIEGYVDVTMDRIGEQLIGTYGRATEALRRRRVEADEASRFVEQILGFDLSPAQFDRGTAFAAGVVERAGHDSLARLWQSPETLPTPAELDAPGLWLARLEFLD